ncbi:hypothetical protein GGTG_07332 [Gaeumannomyces tritici R3-111a-1]|uniref:Uncharacterized protein n=1 Tax=Gaeumannomyces tritici (strain R3-111a-1) TaxID=644352 RepID=J3P1D5_GAET3|nr:hypothetical protein GGTG_07332 [Gaeumannomyces tritici R3-111a-1]EJT77420.1 hypothetical protein GGTG_07332 [Gaeumannomyces tritici R3-111a-1]
MAGARAAGRWACNQSPTGNKGRHESFVGTEFDWHNAPHDAELAAAARATPKPRQSSGQGQDLNVTLFPLFASGGQTMM